MQFLIFLMFCPVFAFVAFLAAGLAGVDLPGDSKLHAFFIFEFLPIWFVSGLIGTGTAYFFED